MTRLLLVTLLFLSSGPAYAEWVAMGTSTTEDGNTLYADPDTIRRKGEMVKMWQLYDLKTAITVAGTSVLSTMVQNEFDCGEERIRLLAFVHFSGNMGRGKMVYEEAIEQKWKPVSPGGFNQLGLQAACLYFEHASDSLPPIPADNLQYIRSSAAQGNAVSQFELGGLYASGDGVPKDIVRAYMWYDLAVAHSTSDGRKDARISVRDYVARRMTPAQIAEAQRLSQQCQAQEFKGC